MSARIQIFACLLVAFVALAMRSRAADAPPAACVAGEDFFASEVWPKVGARDCLKCHKEGGDAEDSRFLLRDPQRAEGAAQAEVMRENRAAFAKMARLKKGEESRLLLKAIGQLDHGGEDVLAADSAGWRVLAEFVRQTTGAPRPTTAAAEKNAPPFFEGVAMLEDRRLLRRLTLSLAGRLPTAAESDTIARGGKDALPALLDAVLREEAFFARLREGFNDVFLTPGIDDGAETVLSYDHFSKTRLWYQKWDLAHIAEKKAREQAGYKLARDYREAIAEEPMRLIDYIVRNERPFTEIVTADYIVVTPYSARGYGVFDELSAQFRDLENPFEYLPVRLHALVGREKSQHQESATGFYPHAGLLSTFQYLRRYPTTETNRNRLRARMFFQHFLGLDVLELAARVSDAAAVTAKFKVPTMEAAECVVCHQTVDPVAGMFQDYWRFAEQGVYGRRKGGWFDDMFGAGFEGEDLPPDERWRALQWLGERTAKDPRFAVAMVEHVYYILTGRRVLLPPKDLDDPLYAARQRAYREQRAQTESIAARFAQGGFNLKGVFKDWALSDFYRADGVALAEKNPARRAELEDVGVVHLLSPEQLERKVAAIFGKGWGRLNHPDDKLDLLYGGIDAQEVTERATDPSGAMGAVQRILANDVACKNVALDFSRPRAERRLFPEIEPDVVPGASAEKDAQILRAIVHLHERVLGRFDAADSPEVERTFALFAGIVGDSATKENFDAQEIYACRQKQNPETRDPTYTLRAWRAVLTYLLRQHEFLYE